MASYESESVEVGVPEGFWIVWVVLGAISAILGVWLILSPHAAAYTLAILLAIGLFFNGIGELAFARDRPHPWMGYALGALFLAAALAVVVDPGIGLKALAVVVGIALLVVGLFQAAAAVLERDQLRHWMWFTVLGLITFAAGFLALVWPRATIFVLALILGIRLTLFGITQIVIGLNLRRLGS